VDELLAKIINIKSWSRLNNLNDIFFSTVAFIYTFQKGIVAHPSFDDENLVKF
jgi:hypothetical protein